MFGSRFWGVVAAMTLMAALALGVGCEEEAKTICCWCECLLDTGGMPEKDIKYTSGTNINCGTSCETACQSEDARWDRGNYAKVSCDEVEGKEES